MRYLYKVLLATLLLQSFSFSLAGQEVKNVETRILELVGESNRYLYDDPTRSLTFANEAYELALDFGNDSLLAVTLNTLGGARWSLGNVEDALAVIQYSVEICEANNYQALLAKNYGSIGNVYSSANLYYDAIGYYKKEGLLQDELGNNSFRRFVINNNLGRAYQQINIFDSAMLYFDKAKLLVDSSIVNLLSVFYFNIAEAHFKNGDIEEADSISRVALENAHTYNSKRGIIRNSHLLAEIDRKRGDTESAFERSRLALKLAEESQKKELLFLTNLTLSNCYADIMDYEMAYKHKKISEEYQEELQGIAAINELELLSYHQRKFQLQVLDEENKMSQKQSNQRKTAIYFLILGLILCFALIAIIIDRNKKIKAQSVELEELNDFKNRLFAVISHDIKSPIQSVAMIVNMLDNDKISHDELRSLMPGVRKKTDQLSDLLNSLLQWAQGKITEKTLHKEPFKLVPLILELKEELAERIKEKKIKMMIDVEDDFELISDPGIIRIVFRNLLINAIKFSWKNSEITVRAMQSRNEAVIEVVDHGVGISLESLQGIFTMEVGSVEGTQGEKGHGLGLVLCNDFIQGQGGKIEVESELGKGSTFKVILPNKAD